MGASDDGGARTGEEVVLFPSRGAGVGSGVREAEVFSFGFGPFPLFFFDDFDVDEDGVEFDAAAASLGSGLRNLKASRPKSHWHDIDFWRTDEVA